MSYCKNCGTLNENESFFCASCGYQLTDKSLSSNEPQVLKISEIDSMKEEKRYRQMQNRVDSFRFSLNKKYYSLSSDHTRYIILLLGGLSILMGLTILLEEYPSLPSVPSLPSFPSFPTLSGFMIFPIGLTILASVFIFMVARDSNRDPVVFWIFEVFILTFGLAILLPEASNIVIPIGLIFAGLLFVFLLSRHLNRDPTLFIGLAIFVLTFNLSIMLPNSTDIIFPICFILIGFLMCFWALKQHPRASLPTKEPQNH